MVSLATNVGSATRRVVEKPWEKFGRLGDYTHTLTYNLG